MKRVLFLCLCLMALLTHAQPVATIELSNPFKKARHNVPVVEDLTQLPKGDYVVIEHIIKGERPELLQEVPSQMTADGIVFLADVPAKGKSVFSIHRKAESRGSSTYPQRVYAQLKLRDQKLRYPRINSIEFKGDEDPRYTYDAIYGHGAMWESQYMGFRIYMDHRQSIDLYGKKYQRMELDTVNFYSNRDLLAKGFGEDVLWAGQSVAAGSFRGLRDGKPVYVDSVSARGQRIVEAGPLRTVVEVWDKDWKINGKTLQMRQFYTMYGGHRDVQVDIYLEGASDTDVFATGAQKLEMENEGFAGAKGLVGSWGRNVPEKGAPDLIEGVGIGVYADSQYVTRVIEDELNYLLWLHPVNGHIRYYLNVCADMQQEGGFHSAKEWFENLRTWRNELRAPLKKITILDK